MNGQSLSAVKARHSMTGTPQSARPVFRNKKMSYTVQGKAESRNPPEFIRGTATEVRATEPNLAVHGTPQLSAKFQNNNRS